MRLAVSLAASVTAAALAFAPDARAVGTRTFELDSLDKLSGGDLKGVSVGSDGIVRAGWTLGDVPLPEASGATATCAAQLADGSILVGVSGGKIVQVAADHATVYADTKENAVTALAVDRSGAVYAGTTSNKVYKVTAGKADVYATLADVESVLALVIDPRTGAVYAGGGAGSSGKVVRVEPGAASSVYLKTSEPFVVSLAIGADGVVYAGTSGKAMLYRIAAAGRATVLYEFPGEDVHAIAVGPSQIVWAAANETSSGTTESTETSSTHRASPRAPAGPTTAPHTKPGKGSLWRFDAQGRPEKVMHHDEFHYLSLALGDDGTPFVGTGAEGRVYTVDDAHQVSLVADTDERQIGALVMSGKNRYVMGSDPAVAHRVLTVGGPDSVWTSKALDAGLRARFGHVHWTGAGSLEVSTRTGDTRTPDTTWSAWSTPVGDGGPTSSPPGRFVQVRARMRDAAATISNVSLAFVTENLRAVVTEIGSHAKHEGKDKDKEIPSSGSEPPRHDAVVHLTWKVDNPDNDELRYRVQFRREGQTRWLDATSADDVLTKAELDWDTSSLAEGKYRVRVDASDEMANPPGDVLHFSLDSTPVLVDNTPPVIKTIAVQGRRLKAEVVDGLGPIARAEVAVDGRVEWRPVAPTDGIFDTADETIDADLSLLLPVGSKGHVVALRAYDAAGNYVVRDVEVP
jgi:hypothetical protein